MKETKSILLLHGALGCASDLTPLEDALVARKWKVRSFDFSGHGRRPFGQNFEIDQFVLELEQYVQEHQLRSSCIFGYSMGGYVALRAASAGKLGTSPIFTLGTKINWTKDIIEQEKGFCNIDLLKSKFPAFEENLRKKHDRTDHLLSLTAAMIGKFEEQDPHSWLPEISNQLYVGLGDRDRLVNYEECRQLTREIKGAGMYMLPNTPHQLEQVNFSLLASLMNEIHENQR